MARNMARLTAARPRKRSPRWPWVLAVLALLVAIRVVTIEPRPLKPALDNKSVDIIAHQGASGHAPSNTLESMRLAMQQGTTVLEMDIHLTKDGVVVLSHDETIDRLTNGKGYISQMTLAELRQFDFGYGFTPDKGQTYPWRGKGVKIPTLEEVLREFKGTRMVIEIKQKDPAMEQQVWELIQRYQMADQVILGTFHGEVAKRWRALTGEQTAYSGAKSDMYTFAAFYIPYLDWLYNPAVDAFQIPRAQKLGPVTIRLDTERLVNRAHKLGVKVHYWTINDEEAMRHLINIGADGIITDYPDRLAKVLKEVGR